MNPQHRADLLSDFESRHPELMVKLFGHDAPARGVKVHVLIKSQPDTPRWIGEGGTVELALEDVERQMDPEKEQQRLREDYDKLERVLHELKEE